MTSEEIIEKRVSLRVAAKLVGRRYHRVKRLIDEGKLRAWRRGRAIEVIPDELGEALLKDERYIPPAPVAPRRPTRRVVVTNSDLTC